MSQYIFDVWYEREYGMAKPIRCVSSSPTMAARKCAHEIWQRMSPFQHSAVFRVELLGWGGHNFEGAAPIKYESIQIFVESPKVCGYWRARYLDSNGDEVEAKNDPPLQILSLGAGVQSTTILRMSILGELPRLDAAIFADTGWEREATYAHVEVLKKEAEDAGIPLHIVQAREGLRKNLTDSAEGERYASIPVHVKNPDGSIGFVRRQCTKDFKIAPIEKKVREMLGVKKGQRVPKGSTLVQQWLGITVDEVTRIKSSQLHWQELTYPLIDVRPMTRPDCIAWNVERGFSVPPRSACVGCPFQGVEEWSQLKQREVDDAAEVEDAIQGQDDWKGVPFLHRSCKPLREVDLRNDIQKGQGTLWNMECDGFCGV